jgi:hypothetical protein
MSAHAGGLIVCLGGFPGVGSVAFDFVVVRLLCSEKELSRCTQILERVGRKFVDPVDAITNVRNYTVLDTDVSDTLTLDTTNLSPEVAAAAILAHISAQSG